jgi:hypothetical protein
MSQTSTDLRPELTQTAQPLEPVLAAPRPPRPAQSRTEADPRGGPGPLPTTREEQSNEPPLSHQTIRRSHAGQVSMVLVNRSTAMDIPIEAGPARLVRRLIASLVRGWHDSVYLHQRLLEAQRPWEQEGPLHWRREPGGWRVVGTCLPRLALDDRYKDSP